MNRGIRKGRKMKRRFVSSGTGLPAAVLNTLLVCLSLPAVAFAAEEGGGKWGALLLVGRLFNVGLVVLVLVWLGRKPLKEFFVSRTQRIKEQLEEAQLAQQQADRRLAEIRARMSNLDEELKQIRENADREARAEYDRLVAEAGHEAERILARARQEIEAMTRTAQIELKAHAAELSIRLAEEKIRQEITDEDRGRLFGRFVRSLGGRG